MNKFVASIGMAAVGASALQTASAQDVGGDPNKPWRVSATLRGFYDDNVATAPDGALDSEGNDLKIDSFGVEIRPSAGFVYSLDQTTLSLGYVYSLKWYEERPEGYDDTDHTHLFDAALTHAFSERYKLSLKDSFAIGQEADIFRNQGGFGGFQNTPGDNIRNYADIGFDVELTPVFGLALGYNNAFYDYDDELDAGETFASNSGRLDRIEHYLDIEGRWLMRPQTYGLLGYQFGLIDYTSDELLLPLAVTSEERNNRSHYIYAGLDHRFSPALDGSIRVGARVNDYYNAETTDVSPYAKGTLGYTYAEGSRVSARISYDRTATDVVGNDSNDVITDAQTLSLYLGVDHRLAPKLFATVSGQYQNSRYEGGGTLDGEADNFFNFDANLRYEFNQYFSSHIGYQYDQLDSDVAGREFDRNRVYIGVTATY